MDRDQPALENIDVNFGATLREAREARGVSQAQLAVEMRERGFDFHQQTVYKIESGNRKVTVGEAVGLADVLGLETIDRLVGGGRALRIALLKRAAEESERDFAEAGRRLLEAQVRLAHEFATGDEYDEDESRELREALNHTLYSIAARVEREATGWLEHEESIDPSVRAFVVDLWRSTTSAPYVYADRESAV